jgi:Cft2 family RNA processing exonuclease
VSTAKLKPLGGGGEIGANCYQVECDGHRVLLDCGLHPKEEGRAALPDFSALDGPPEAILVTHGHVDHCGSLPYLLKMFPGTPWFATEPTVTIIERMLHNSVSVMEMLGTERGIEGYPLYGHHDVDAAMRLANPMQYDDEFSVDWGGLIRARFYHSGHVLGAGSIYLKFRGHSLYYSGDVCASNQELLAGLTAVEPEEDVDTLIIEGTRGAHEGADTITLEEEVVRFGAEISRVLKQNGAVLVPSFALGRTQEVLNVLSRLVEEGRIPDAPIYASGLGRAIYEIYSKYPHYLREEAELRPLYEFDRIGDVWDISVVRKLISKPCIIVATSGMMVENTPSAMIAREMVRHQQHGIFFVGYLDPDTLGYKVLHAETGDALTFEVGGSPVQMELENRKTFSFSAHAPREDLVRLVHHVNPRNVVFVHGDVEALQWLSENCDGLYRKYTPQLAESVSLETA